MDSRKKVVWGVVVLLVALVTGVVWVGHRQTSDKSRRTITIAQYGDVFLYAPLYIAKDAGFFARRGLDVSLVSTGGDEKTWAAVTSGNASFGVADPTFVAISGSRGQPGKVIASVVNGVPFWGITFNSKIGTFSGPKDLDNLTVATFPAPSTAYTLQRNMFMQAGLPPKIREGAFGTLLTMLRTNQADIALELEPNVSQSEKQGAHVVYSMRDLYGDFAITGLTTTPELVAKNPELVRDVVCSLQMALDYSRREPQAAVQILIKRFPEISPEIARAAFSRLVAERIVPETVSVQPAAWQKAIDLRKSVGDLNNPGPMNDYVDDQFAIWATQTCRGK